ncbi:putative disease resistance protein RGA3 [Miscanthus floridulus]|uniref:putative disease resistance protein RGA3 n=1 Tax=Miscanthus floridulus TaxID=154761 RepID=UPI003457DE44
MAGVGELLASAALKQVSGMLGTAIWKAVASQLKLGDDLNALKDTVDSIHEGMVKLEKRLMKDGDVRVWMRELKAAAYDMEDMIMEFEGDILRNRDGSSPRAISIPVKLRLTMPGKLKDMKRRLENIEKLRRFDLMADTSSDDQDMIQMRATGPCLEEGIVGRDKDKAELMKLLQEDCKHAIIPIYGFGGLGKTTLAQMVFDDSTTKRDFDICVWVYVSTKFSNEKIGRSIISQVDEQGDQYDLPSVQKRVEMILSGEKYLVVLDDLWEENTSNLNQLKAMLKGGQHLDQKREITHQLFKDKAFPNGSEESDEFVKVGEKIVQKCGGVPLAVKSLGDRLLDMPLRKWEETLKSELWEGEHRAQEYLQELRQRSFLEATSASTSHDPYPTFEG